MESKDFPIKAEIKNKAMHHVHDHKGELQEPPFSPVTDEQVEKAVDDVLKDIDLNGDGLIDYSEFIRKMS